MLEQFISPARGKRHIYCPHSRAQHDFVLKEPDSRSYFCEEPCSLPPFLQLLSLQRSLKVHHYSCRIMQKGETSALSNRRDPKHTVSLFKNFIQRTISIWIELKEQAKRN